MIYDDSMKQSRPSCINCAWTSEMCLRTCAPDEDSDQPAHSRSLIWIFAGRLLDSHECNVSSCRQRRYWSDQSESLCAHVSWYVFWHCRSNFFVRYVIELACWQKIISLNNFLFCLLKDLISLVDFWVFFFFFVVVFCLFFFVFFVFCFFVVVVFFVVFCFLLLFFVCLFFCFFVCLFFCCCFLFVCFYFFFFFFFYKGEDFCDVLFAFLYNKVFPIRYFWKKSNLKKRICNVGLRFRRGKKHFL